MAATRTASAETHRPRKIAVILLALLAIAVAVMVLRDHVDEAIKEVTLPLRHDDIIRQQSREKGVDAALIASVINAESGFRDQTSSAGARGLMQLTPDTADYVEQRSGGKTFTFEDLADPDINIRYGTFYLREMLERYGGSEVAALAAYNAGPGNVDEWGGSDLEVGDIEFPETMAYVEKVIDKRDAYRERYAKELGY